MTTSMTTTAHERPVLFKPEMVRAILDNRKSQTRCLVKPQPRPDEELSWCIPMPNDSRALVQWTHKGANGVHLSETVARCPYGRVGDVLYVKETWSTLALFDDWKPSEFDKRAIGTIRYAADGKRGSGRLRSALHLPKWAARIRLEITGIKVERVNEISEEDAIAEGVIGGELDYYDPSDDEVPPDTKYWMDYSAKSRLLCHPFTPRDSFRTLWDSIHGSGSFESGPWVWAISFRRLT